MGDAIKEDNKTNKQLVHELTELHSQNAGLKKSMTGSISAELAAEEVLRYAESIVETVREPLLVLNADLKIISANRNFYRTFKVIPGETISSFIYDLGNKQWDIPKLRELLEEVLPEKEAFDDFEVDHNFQDIGHKIMLLNARQIYRKDPASTGTIVAYPASVALAPFTDPYFRGFDNAFPDYYRFKEWEREFDTKYAKDVKDGGEDLPALSLVRFMHDHTGNFATAIDGVNTPELQQADNDYAVGLLVEKISKSKYAQDPWPTFSIRRRAPGVLQPLPRRFSTARHCRRLSARRPRSRPA